MVEKTFFANAIFLIQSAIIKLESNINQQLVVSFSLPKTCKTLQLLGVRKTSCENYVSYM